jgi:hypothetical protein
VSCLPLPSHAELCSCRHSFLNNESNHQSRKCSSAKKFAQRLFHQKAMKQPQEIR